MQSTPKIRRIGNAVAVAAMAGAMWAYAYAAHAGQPVRLDTEAMCSHLLSAFPIDNMHVVIGDKTAFVCGNASGSPIYMRLHSYNDAQWWALNNGGLDAIPDDMDEH